jgi:hypothetical protein
LPNSPRDGSFGGSLDGARRRPDGSLVSLRQIVQRRVRYFARQVPYCLPDSLHDGSFGGSLDACPTACSTVRFDRGNHKITTATLNRRLIQRRVQHAKRISRGSVQLGIYKAFSLDRVAGFRYRRCINARRIDYCGHRKRRCRRSSAIYAANGLGPCEGWDNSGASFSTT